MTQPDFQTRFKQALSWLAEREAERDGYPLSDDDVLDAADLFTTDAPYSDEEFLEPLNKVRSRPDYERLETALFQHIDRDGNGIVQQPRVLQGSPAQGVEVWRDLDGKIALAFTANPSTHVEVLTPEQVQHLVLTLNHLL